MADRYQSAVTSVLTLGAATVFTHGLTAGGAQVAPDQVLVSFLHGSSIGANSVRWQATTAVATLTLDQPLNPAGAPSAVTCRIDFLFWHSQQGGR